MIITKYFDLNDKGRDFVCGDIHGMLDKLNDKLARLNFDKAVDRLFCVGDLIDRGPHSLECLKLIQEPWFFSNRGNHEEFMIAYTMPGVKVTTYCSPSTWINNGGTWYLRDKDQIDNKLLADMLQLPLISIVQTKKGRINIVHAEFPDFTSDAKIDAQDFDQADLSGLLWGRQRISLYRPVDSFAFDMMDANLSTTFVGHTPLNEVRAIGKYLYIDTGACFEQSLSENKRPLTIIEL